MHKLPAMRAHYLVCVVFSLIACGPRTPPATTVLPEVPEGAEAVSLFGKPLLPAAAYAASEETYQEKKSAVTADPGDADKWIWYGRWAGYAGHYREAIRIYSEAMQQFPEDARLFRHRGHRYLSIRALDAAIADFEKAAQLTAGKPDEIEPDGQPNAQGIPTSTLQGNIWYHLGLAHYLKNDLEKARQAYEKGLAISTTDDMRVAFLHWQYMTLRRLGQTEAAQQAVTVVSDSLNIIENFAYHKLCLLYKGELQAEELTSGSFSDIMNDAAIYGVGNWYHYNGDTAQAFATYRGLLDGKSWASFGYIAAEADLARAGF